MRNKDYATSINVNKFKILSLWLKHELYPYLLKIFNFKKREVDSILDDSVRERLIKKEGEYFEFYLFNQIKPSIEFPEFANKLLKDPPQIIRQVSRIINLTIILNYLLTKTDKLETREFEKIKNSLTTAKGLSNSIIKDKNGEIIGLVITPSRDIRNLIKASIKKEDFSKINDKNMKKERFKSILKDIGKRIFEEPKFKDSTDAIILCKFGNYALYLRRLEPFDEIILTKFRNDIVQNKLLTGFKMKVPKCKNLIIQFLNRLNPEHLHINRIEGREGVRIVFKSNTSENPLAVIKPLICYSNENVILYVKQQLFDDMPEEFLSEVFMSTNSGLPIIPEKRNSQLIIRFYDIPWGVIQGSETNNTQSKVSLRLEINGTEKLLVMASRIASSLYPLVSY
ncbi:hypothetical protein [Thermococcus sp. LS2]|uniref:hypothetical protein n=1 Tax=Thermococcus sp. LS2 TaxID=1638260 RepID=UPI0014386DF9|nr:hypothetical protein [Thermococcus sp. LS2]NJE13353.1 hypothetical protein [Thermococcus sp. LS2]